MVKKYFWHYIKCNDKLIINPLLRVFLISYHKDIANSFIEQSKYFVAYLLMYLSFDMNFA
jgi:hypothetical protein